MKNKDLVHGVGINDADYMIYTNAKGFKFRCPFYLKWSNMLARCYSLSYQSIQPTYAGCSVCNEWLTFSNFKRWMEKQDWQGKQLDKDFIVAGNKVYSPETCVFIDKLTNSFATDGAARRGRHPIGVAMHKSKIKFQANCNNPFTHKKEYLGVFNSEIEAHLAWKRRKHELACDLADLQKDARVSNALRVKYL